MKVHRHQRKRKELRAMKTECKYGMLDIAVIIPELCKHGGAERVVLECIARWQYCHKITLYSSKLDHEVLREAGVTSRVHLSEISPYEQGPHAPLLNCALLPRLWEQEIGRHDVYHAHLWPTHLIDLHPMVWYPHEPLRILHDLKYEGAIEETFTIPTRTVHMYPKFSYDSVEDRYREAYFRAMSLLDNLGKPDRIVANSRFSARYLREVYGADVEDVVYPGVTPEDFILMTSGPAHEKDASERVDLNPFGASAKDKVVVTVGQLWAHKRINLIIEAIKFVENVQLYIVGSGPEKENLEKTARLLGVDDRVFILQRLSNHELRILYARSLAVVFVPINEPFGIVALEAMAAGKPLIAANEGGFTEVVDESCALLVEPEPRSIAERVAFLRDNQDAAREMGLSGRKRAERYTWDRTANELMSVIEDTFARWKKKSPHVQCVARSGMDRDVLFGVHYYTWYGQGMGSRHWNDTPTHGGVTDLPLIGCYGSSKGTTIKKHLTLLEETGLDFVILHLHVDSLGISTYELAAIRNVFSVAEERGTTLRFAIQLDPHGCMPEHLAEATTSIDREFSIRPLYLTYEDKPILYLFWSGSLDNRKDWIRRIDDATKGFVRIAGSLRTYRADREPQKTNGLFDGFSLFSPLELSRKANWYSTWREAYLNSSAGKRNIRIATISPGYDDSHLTDPVRRSNPFRQVARDNGATYQSMMDFVISCNPHPHQVLISTFNEFHENTHIEPSIRHGATYMEMTKKFIRDGRERWSKRKT